MEDKLVFDAQWYQSEAGVTHKFLLTYFTKDNTLELYDEKAKKPFLRRNPVDTVCVKDLYPGSRVFVFGRKIHITDFGNAETKQLLLAKSQKAFLLVPGQSKNSLDSIFRKISDLNLKLEDCVTRQITSDDLTQVNLLNDDRIASIKSSILKDPSFLFELSGKSVDKKIDDIQEDCPGVFGSISIDLIQHFFSGEPANNQKLLDIGRDSVLCLIKPHIVHANQTGDLLGKIYREGFLVANMKLCHLDRSQSDEFLRVYEGVVPEFIQMSLHLVSGALIALELVDGSAAEEIHTKFRNLCGPYDSEIAKKLRPHTIRGEFGLNKICNAVHCTDLKEDVQRELEFFFSS